MSGRNRSQKVFLTVESTHIAFLPAGHYSLHIDHVRIEKGSVRIVARIIDTIVYKEELEVKENGD